MGRKKNAEKSIILLWIKTIVDDYKKSTTLDKWISSTTLYYWYQNRFPHSEVIHSIFTRYTKNIIDTNSTYHWKDTGRGNNTNTFFYF